MRRNIRLGAARDPADELVDAVYAWWTYQPDFSPREQRLVAALMDEPVAWTMDPDVERHFWLIDGGMIDELVAEIGPEAFVTITRRDYPDLYGETREYFPELDMPPLPDDWS